MRRITLWFTATVAVVVLLFSYRTSLGGSRPAARTAGAGTGADAPGIVSGPGQGTGAAPSGGATPPSGSTGGGTGGTSGGTVVNGTAEQTRWGPVQVQVTINGGKITDVVALQVPNGNFRDREINSYAVPQLREEVLAAQSARVDTISGATVTSDGYLGSLQAALDAAHFGS
jgi:FMN-binding domain